MARISPSSSEPTSSSTPRTPSISPSTWAPWRRASAITSTVWRVSSTGRADPSKSTEFQPVSRQVVSTSRSGQWSRCSVTGTDAGSATARNMS